MWEHFSTFIIYVVSDLEVELYIGCRRSGLSMQLQLQVQINKYEKKKQVIT